MHKRVTYPGQIPLESDILRTNYFAELGLTMLARAAIGSGPAIRGLPCGATSPASMQVAVGAGEVYTLASLLPVAYSSIPLDTTHQVLKQGILLDAVNLSCPAPGTVGQSIDYLVQVAMVEADADSTLLQYWNAANPSQPFSGVGGNGVSQPQTRACTVAVAVKAGTAATTGSQVTPTPDAGYIGAHVVTVAYGATTLTSGNITTYAGAPFLAADGLLRPALSVYQTADQSLATATWTKLTMATVEIDTTVTYSTANSRWTPKVPGWYQVEGAVEIKVGVTSQSARMALYKNGTLMKSGPISRMSGTGPCGASVATLIYMNGTTDYLEGWGYQDTGSSQLTDSASAKTWWQGVRVA